MDRRLSLLAQLIAAEGAATRADGEATRSELASVRAEIDALRSASESSFAELGDEVRAARAHAADALRTAVVDEPGGRRRVERARLAPDYEEAFADGKPLVSICIPTFDRIELLTERSLPSVLGQTYANLEVIVIGDAAPPEVERAVLALGDPRVRYLNLTHRIDYGSAQRNWEAGSVQARNLGYAEARGAWISDFDDDDVLLPTAIERVIAHARTHRLEAVFGRQRWITPEGQVLEIGTFPPALGQFSWQGGVIHGALRHFAREHAAAVFGIPNDWERAERMLRAGVRFGMLDEITAWLAAAE